MYTKHWKFYLRRRVGRFASAIVANSNAGLEYWKNKSDSTFNRVIRNIVHFDDIESSYTPIAVENFSHCQPFILVAGRYSEEKNLFVLFKSLENILVERPLLHVVSVGAGPLMDELVGFVSSLKCPSQIHILGYSNCLTYLMNRASVYISLSKFEGNPNTVIEAISCGCPVVVSDIPAHREILTEEMCVFVPCHDPEFIEKGVRWTLDNRSTALSMTEVASVNFRKYTDATIASEYINLYEEVLKGDEN